MMLSLLFCSKDISSNQKIELFDLAIPNISQSECAALLDDLGCSELKSIFSKNVSWTPVEI